MAGLTIYPLRFTLEALDEITFDERAGAQLRGALYSALREYADASPVPKHPASGLETDPVRRCRSEVHFTIGITLFGTSTLELLPFIVGTPCHSGARPRPTTAATYPLPSLPSPVYGGRAGVRGT
jgi:hypothetical protein